MTATKEFNTKEELMKETVRVGKEKKPKELNIYQKLVEVRKSVGYIKKEAEGHGYTYVSESQILGSLKSKLDEHGIWIDLNMKSLENVTVAVYSKKLQTTVQVGGVRASFEFTVINSDNPEEKIVRTQILQDTGSEVKTIGGLQTYANKYFMLKFFNIPTDKLDPDKFDKVIEKSTSSEVKEPIKENPKKEEVPKTITKDQIETIKKLLDGDVSIWNLIKNKFKFENVPSISQDKFGTVVTFINLQNMQKGKSNVNC